MKSKLILSIDDFSKKFIVSESQVAILEDFDIYIENLPTSTNDTQYTIEEVSIEILDFNKTSIFSVKTAGEFTEEGYCIEGLKINSTKAVKAFRLSPRTQRMVMTLWITYSVQTINGDASEASVETINTYYGNAFVKIHNAPTTDGMEVDEAVTQIEQHDADPNAHAALFKGVEDDIEALHETISSEVAARILQEETNRNNAINLAIKEQGLDTIKSLVDGAATSASAAAISAEAAGKTLDEVSALAVDTKEYKEAAEGFKEESEQILEDVTSKKIDIDAKVSQFNSTYAEATTNIENFENTSAQANREIEELKSNALTALDEKETATTLAVSLAGAQQVALVEQKAEDEASNLESLATTLKEEIEGSISGFDADVAAAVLEVNNAGTSGVTKVVNAQTTAEGAIEDATSTGVESIENKTAEATNAVNQAVADAEAEIDGKVEVVNEAVESAQTAASNANESASSASTSATNASASATQATNAKDATVAIKDELQDSLDVVDNAESVMLKKANVIDFMPIRNYIYTYFGKDEYLTFAGLTQLDNGDFIVASAKYKGGVDGKLLVFFQFNQQLEFVHKIEITLTDGIYGNFCGHFVVVDGVLNHIIRGIRREFILDVEGKISLGNTYTIDASALGVNPWDTSNVQEFGETQAFVLGNYIVYEKFVLNKNTNIVESLLASRITSVTEPVATSTSFVWFVANRKTAYKATIDSEGAISFTQGGTYAIPGYPTESVRIAHTNNGTDTVLLSALCGTPNFGTGDIKVYSLLWGFAYGTGVGVFSPNIFTDDRVISQRLFTSSKDNLFFFDSTNKMFHLLLGRSTHYRISDYMLDAHLQFKIEQSKAKIISSNSKGVLFVASTKTTGQILSPQIFRGFQEITHAYYIPWEQE